MKIGIISDTHDNLPNLKKAVDFFKKEGVKAVFHCGDIFKPETIKQGFVDYPGEIYLVLSKPDEFYFQKLEKEKRFFDKLYSVKIWKGIGKTQIESLNIAFCHVPQKALKLSLSQRYDLIFFGHTHKPWKIKMRKSLLVNPGNLAGIIFKASFALYNTETKSLDLKILEKL